jgi:hypothetical protein
MDAEPPLDYLLDGPTGPTPGRDELLAIVARSRARRFRVVAVGLAVTLVVGAGGGWLVGSASGNSSGGTTLAEGGSPTTRVAAGALPAAGVAVAPGAFGAEVSGPPFIKRFVRTTGDGVTLRAYEVPGSGGVLPLLPCGGNGSSTVETLPPSLDVEVSTASVADQVYSGFAPYEAPFQSISESTIGVAEGAPVWVVTVRIAPSVATVKVTFSDGRTDQMAPIAGWAVLAHAVPTGSGRKSTLHGTVEARDAAGKLIAGVTFPIEPVVTGAPTTIVFSPPVVPETTLPGTAVGGTPTQAGPAIPPITANAYTTQTLPPTAIAPEPCGTLPSPPSPIPATTVPAGG